MKTKPNYTAAIILIFIYINIGFSQVQTTFNPRFNQDIKGDISIIANNMISRHPTNAYNGTSNNNDFTDNVYVDIDNDNTTFNSSNATFNSSVSSATCLTIRKAYLYWAAADFENDSGNDNQPNWNYNQVKIQLPGESSYSTLTADQVIYRGRDTHFSNDPYVCFKDITDSVTNLSSPFGIYQIANVEGKIGGLTDHFGINTGTSGGWQIVFIYENETLPTKNISVFDGYAHVTRDTNNFNITFNGFITPPTGDVNADLIIGSLEGDRNLTGDRLQIEDINGTFVDITSTLRNADNFFNSRISLNGANFTDRTPASLNTLGFDAAILPLDNSNKSIISNNDTSATIRMTSDQETYGLFLMGLSVDVWAPNFSPLPLTSNPNTTNFNPGDSIDFSFPVLNSGNDNALGLQISTTLPPQLTFQNANVQTGVTYTYDLPSRLLTFFFANGITDVNDPVINLDFSVIVNDQCYFLEDSCDLSFDLQLTASYTGEQNTDPIKMASSNSVNECGVGDMQAFTGTINQPDMAQWVNPENDLDRTIECSDIDALNDAQALFPTVDKCNFTIIKTSGSLNEDNSCPNTGTYINTWTFTDACGRTIQDYVQTITIEDTTAPVLTSCNIDDLSITTECLGDDIETVANQWNLDNIALLENCASDTCNINISVSSDYDFANFIDACGNTGTISVIYTISDECGNSITQNATLNIEDTTDPVLTACNVDDLSITTECLGDDIEAVANQWNLDNIATLENCASDTCDTNISVSSDYDFANFNAACGNTGNISVTYTISDECGNSITQNASLNIEDTTDPVLTACNVDDLSITTECLGDDIETVANQWNIDNIALLENCASDSCDTNISVSSDYDFANFNASCGNTGTISVIYTISDECGNSITQNATLNIEDTTDPVLTACNVDDLSITTECLGDDIEAVANQWNLDNIATLENCASDSCDTNISVSSDYDFANFNAACGNTGNISVIYTINDECGNSITQNTTLTIEDTSDPVLTSCNVDDLSITTECLGDDIETVANQWNLDNIATLENCASDTCDTNISVSSDYDFANFNAACGNTGSISVTYTISDECGNSITQNAILNIEDTTDPVLTACNVDDLSITTECLGDAIEAVANQWNLDNIATLENCASDSCDTNISVSSDYDFANFNAACGNTGSISVTYTISDECGNSITQNATLNIEDTTDPVLTACNVDNLSITTECLGDAIETVANQWNLDNISTLENCASDSCDTNISVSSDYDFANFNAACGNTGSISVTYTISDECGNSITQNAILNIEDNTDPVLTACNVDDLSTTAQCIGADNQTLADQWNLDNIALLENCASDTCDSNISVSSDYDYTNLNTSCGGNGSLTVNYTISDECGNSIIQTAILTIENTSAPDLSACTLTSETLQCNGPDNEPLVTQWNQDNISLLENCATDFCSPNLMVTSDFDFNNYIATCANSGSITITYTITDDCNNSITVSADLTIEDTSAPILTSCNVDDLSITTECQGDDIEAVANQWNLDNIATLENCASDSCDTNISVSSDYDFANFNAACGNTGNISVIYTISDECGNSITQNATLNIEDTSDPVLTACNVDDLSITTECLGDDIEAVANQWNLDNIATLENCASDSCDTNISVSSDYDFANFNAACGNTGNISVIYTISDECGNSITQNATLNIEDTTDPVLTACNVDDLSTTAQCIGADNQALADQWNLDNIALLENCASDTCDSNISVSSDYDYTNLNTSCGGNGSLTVNYTISDECGNSIIQTAILTIENTSAPDLSACTLASETLQCNGPDNEPLVSQWNQDNISLLENCATDSCSPNLVVTSDFDFNNYIATCANSGSITITYTITDDCNNSITVSADLTIEDTSAPILTTCNVDDLSITTECLGDNIEAVANQWNLDNIATLENCASDTCDTNISVSSDYDFANFNAACGNTGTISVTYTISDECGNSITQNATLNIEDNTDPVLTACNVDDLSIITECLGDDIEAVANQWNSDNIATLENCASDTCDTNISVSSDYDFANFSAACGNTGNISVTYTISDECGNSITQNATLNIEDTTDPILTACNVDDLSITTECIGDAIETVANQWNSDNIATLENCALDTCDTNISVSSDYDFANFNAACGNTGNISVTYTISDECVNSITQNATLNIEDNTDPVLTACNVDDLSITTECLGDAIETVANQWNLDNIATLENCASDSCDTNISVSSDYDFANFNAACGNTGNISVIYTISDECGNSITQNATLNIEDTTDPVLTACNVDDLSIITECLGDDIEAVANQWNLDNISTLENCASDTCDTNISVSSDYDFANFNASCGNTGNISVIYTISDECGNSITQNATLNIEDTTDPVLTACNVDDLSITTECLGDDIETVANQWNLDNIALLENCASDSCDTNISVSSDYDFANFNAACGNTGNISVTYTISDECGNSITQNATLNIEDNTDPVLTACNVDDLSITTECLGDDIETVANQWNLDNIATLENCASDTCDTNISVSSDYDFTNFNAACGNTGNISVIYTISDECGNSITQNAILNIEDTTDPVLTACNVDDLSITTECLGDDIEAVANQWNLDNIATLENCASDTCDTNISVSSDYDFANFNTACGNTGNISVIYTISDECGNSITQNATLNIEDTTDPVLTACNVDDLSITTECLGDDIEAVANQWNSDNIATLENCASDTCDTNISVSSDYDFANFNAACGNTGTISVTYTISDECGNSITQNATLNIEDTTDPILTACNVDDLSITTECLGDDIETVANQWNLDNIALLENCASDTCDTNISVSSDYDFANFNAACGNTGTISVIYTISDECGNSITQNATLNIEDTTDPVLTACNVDDLSITTECLGDDIETVANQWNLDNIALLENCASDTCDTNISVSSDYDFANFNAACGNTGNISVIYTISDECGNSITQNATLNIEDTTDPVLTACNVDDLSITTECLGDDIEAVANQWNLDNIALLENCASDTCDTNISVSSDYDFANFNASCGNTGNISVTYTISDECGNSITQNATLNIEDTTDPVLTACNVDDLSITTECLGDDIEAVANQWNLDNITLLENCASDSCDTNISVSSDYDFANFNAACGNTGSISVTYTISDECGNSITQNATLNIEDTTDPVLTACNVDDLSITTECLGDDIEAVANQWNLNNIATLENCASDSCDTNISVSSDYDFANFNAACGNTGTISVIYTISDECGNSITQSATLNIEDNTDPVLTACNVDDLSITTECLGDDIEAVANQWNLDNIATLENCASDSCDTNISVSSDYDFANFNAACGNTGTISVIYTISDECGNSITQNATLNIEDTTDPVLTACNVNDLSIDTECMGNDTEEIADQWNLDNIALLENCASDTCDTNISISSDYDFANFNAACGNTGNISVTYTISDECGNSITQNATLNIEDTSDPVLTACNVDDLSITTECLGDAIETVANQWNLDNIALLENCASDSCDTNISVSSDYDFANFNAACGNTGNISVTYTISDECGNSITQNATLNIEDNTDPVLTACNVDDLSIITECLGDDIEAVANQWNSDNIATLENCASDTCNTNISVSSDYDFANFNAACGNTGTISVTYTISDECGNSITQNATLNIEDTSDPVLTDCNVDDLSIDTECMGNDTEEIADQWNLDNIALLENCASDTCDTNISISSDYDFSNVLTNQNGSFLTVTYTISDECGNETLIEATLSSSGGANVIANNVSICVTDEIENQPFDLFTLLNGDFNGTGTWQVISGQTTLNGSEFSPIESELGFIVLNYFEDDAFCPIDLNVTIEIHERCGVLACGDDLTISKVVTPNGDGINDVFEINGIENCNFILDLKIINRWGAIIYENPNYKNNWNASVAKSSLGSASHVPNGTYYYILNLKNSGIKTLTGPIYVGTK